jgi:hypothetical protein
MLADLAVHNRMLDLLYNRLNPNTSAIETAITLFNARLERGEG